MNENIEKYLKEFAQIADTWFKERIFLEDNYKFFNDFFQLDKIKDYEWKNFQEIGEHIFAFSTNALAKGRALGKLNLPIEDYRRLFDYIKTSEDSIDLIIDNLNNKENPNFYLPFFGPSSISELICYAHPNKYIFYNKRDIDALNKLGAKLDNLKNESFGSKFKRFNEAMQPIIASYENIVGKRTKTTLQLEVDQFFSWFYENNKIPSKSFKQIIDELREQLKIDETILNKFEVKEIKDDERYAWVQDQYNIIGNSIAHYEIKNRRSTINVEIHFEGNKSENDRFYNNITELPANIEWFEWRKSKSISYSKDIPINSETIIEQIKEALLYLEENLGDKIRSIISSKYWIYAPGVTASEWHDFYSQGIMGLEWDELGDLNNYVSKEEIVKKLQELYETDSSKKNDSSACWDIKNSIKNGDFIIAKSGKSIILGYGIVTSDYYFDENVLTFKHRRKIDWKTEGEWQFNHNIVKTLTDISDNKDFVTQLMKLFETTTSNNNIKTSNNNIKTSKMTLNQILYGPPGTGKTYNTINKAIGIVKPDFDLNQDRKIIKEEFNRLVKDGQIVFTTFHQSMGYEDFIEGIKPITDEEKDGNVTYDIIPGIFKRICEDAKTPNQLNFEKAYDKLKEELSDGKLVEMETPKHSKYFVSLNSNNNLKLFTGGNKDKSQGTLTKENIQKSINGEKQLWYDGYFQGVVNYLKSNFNYNTLNSETKNYVLIIDEINRGNVSQIFGELITLIEDDKRLGNDEALEIILPYSKELFSVPPNLYIIGTMNTADRSVEALDTALRRRFSFEEMPSNPDLIKNEGVLKDTNGVLEGIDLVNLLGIINNRLEKLLDKDHLIGHSYFMNIKTIEELEVVFRNKVIPLLQEYFYGDYGKIGLVLGNGFVKMSEGNDDNLFADFDYENKSDFDDREVFELHCDDFRNALILVMEKKQK